MLTWKKSLILAAAGLALSAPARAQLFGISATYGSVNDISHTLNLEGFKPSEYTVSFDYRFEHAALLRMTYGSMWTQQSQSGQTVNGVYVPSAKEHINYLTADASYLYTEGFYTGGLFGGIGGYSVVPEPMPPGFEAYRDPNQKYFGFNLGADGEFRLTKGFAIVLRLTYHNISSSPSRQFFNADAGLVGRF
ncbi:MAG TPA: outer membrane beta-barrel protein [Thermoanaerobaculia bacterium]|nr:outer membrane beta-barrel protein [Thermoanaerobaculia bacterium]